MCLQWPQVPWLRAPTATEPCWATVQAGAPLDVEGESGERRLASTKSNGILKRCSGPVARKGVGQNHLIADPILFWLWAVDPDAYFFAYVRSGKLQALPTPARPDSPRVPVQATVWASGSHTGADRSRWPPSAPACLRHPPSVDKGGTRQLMGS